MREMIRKMDLAILNAKAKLMAKKEGNDQLIVMFIIIAVAAGVAGLLYIFAKGTLLPNFQNKITNLIDNWFKNCMHYQANYEEVLVQMMGQIASGLSAREDRKNILFSSKLTLTVISITSVIIVWIIGAGLDIDVKSALIEHTAGQVILLITGLLYLMVGVKMFGTDK